MLLANTPVWNIHPPLNMTLKKANRYWSLYCTVRRLPFAKVSSPWPVKAAVEHKPNSISQKSDYMSLTRPKQAKTSFLLMGLIWREVQVTMSQLTWQINTELNGLMCACIGNFTAALNLAHSITV